MRGSLAAGARCVWMCTRIARTTADPTIRRDAMETLSDIAEISPYETLQFAAARALASIVGQGAWDLAAIVPPPCDGGYSGDAA